MPSLYLDDIINALSQQETPNTVEATAPPAEQTKKDVEVAPAKQEPPLPAEETHQDTAKMTSGYGEEFNRTYV